MTAERPTVSPARLLQTSQTLETLFTDAESAYRDGLNETRAWRRLQSRLAAADETVNLPRPARPWLWLTAAVAAGFLLGWLGSRSVQPAPIAAIAPALSPGPSSSRDNTGFSLRLGAGKSLLPDGTEVELTNGAQGTFRSEKRRSTLEIDQGRLDIAVPGQTRDRPFIVKALSYEFVVLGTKFGVSIAEPRVELDVTEGRVAVHDATRMLKVVEVGGHWSNLDESQAPLTAAPSAIRPASPALSAKAESQVLQSATPTDPSSCRDLSRNGKPKQAEQCYVTVAKGDGLFAEMALYDMARLRRDILSNPSTALAALDEYESRFASGTLAPEVRMARIELLARSGRADEALEASELLLNSPSGRARAVELHLLRGNLLCDKKHDCAAAVAEYRQIESDPGPRGDQAQFACARCLERLGRGEEAIEAYRSYLGRPRPQQTARARERLHELQP